MHHSRIRSTRNAALKSAGLLAAALTFVFLLAGIAHAQGAKAEPQLHGSLTVEDLRALNRDVHDPKRAAAAVAQLRAYLGADPDTHVIAFARTAIVRGLIESGATSKEISGAADTAETTLKGSPEALFRFYTDVAQALVLRNAELPRASGYLHRALFLLPEGNPRTAQTRAVLQGTLGQAQLQSGHGDSAAATLEAAYANHPDSLQVLLGLGQAYEKSGRTDRSIDAYVRSLACYPREDTAAAAPLRVQWKKKHGSLAGMNEAVTAARDRSRNEIAFESRRHEAPMPAWTLPSLAGDSLKSSQHAGKVMVVDFWGSWCGPCREELPIFQRIYEKYRNKGVVFVGMNWEQPGMPEARVQKARDYMAKNKFTFPVALDHERQACDAFGINAFPTAYMIDKKGMIRYRNIGVAPGIEQILTDQIESLLK